MRVRFHPIHTDPLSDRVTDANDCALVLLVRQLCLTTRPEGFEAPAVLKMFNIPCSPRAVQVLPSGRLRTPGLKPRSIYRHGPAADDCGRQEQREKAARALHRDARARHLVL